MLKWQPTCVYLLNIDRTSVCIYIHLYCCSDAKLYQAFCHPIKCSTPDSPVLHYLPEITPTHVHWVSDAIQPSHSLSSPSPPTLNLSQHQGHCQWVIFFSANGQRIRASASAPVFSMHIQGWFPLGLTVWSPCWPRDSQECSPAPQFERINSSALSLLSGPSLWSHIHTRLLEKP